jgi:hypothetical protein
MCTAQDSKGRLCTYDARSDLDAVGKGEVVMPRNAELILPAENRPVKLATMLVNKSFAAFQSSRYIREFTEGVMSWCNGRLSVQKKKDVLAVNRNHMSACNKEVGSELFRVLLESIPIAKGDKYVTIYIDSTSLFDQSFTAIVIHRPQHVDNTLATRKSGEMVLQPLRFRDKGLSPLLLHLEIGCGTQLSHANYIACALDFLKSKGIVNGVIVSDGSAAEVLACQFEGDDTVKDVMEHVSLSPDDDLSLQPGLVKSATKEDVVKGKISEGVQCSNENILGDGYPVHVGCLCHYIHWLFSHVRSKNVFLFNVTERLKEVIKISHSKHMQQYFTTKCASFTETRWFSIDLSMDWLVKNEKVLQELVGESDMELIRVVKELQPTIKVFDFLLHYFEKDDKTLGNVFYVLCRAFSSLCHFVSRPMCLDVVRICTELCQTLYLCTLGCDNGRLHALAFLFTMTGQSLFARGNGFVCFVPLHISIDDDDSSKSSVCEIAESVADGVKDKGGNLLSQGSSVSQVPVGVNEAIGKTDHRNKSRS